METTVASNVRAEHPRHAWVVEVPQGSAIGPRGWQLVGRQAGGHQYLRPVLWGVGGGGRQGGGPAHGGVRGTCKQTGCLTETSVKTWEDSRVHSGF